MENKEIVKKLMELNSLSLENLNDELTVSSKAIDKLGWNDISFDINTTIEANIERKEKEKQLKHGLISKENYESWLEKQQKIENMNEETKNQRAKNKEEWVFKNELNTIAVHLKYMQEISSNKNVNSSFFQLNFDEFQKLILKHKISNDPYIVNIVQQYSSIVDNANKNSAILKIVIGLSVLTFFMVRSCS